MSAMETQIAPLREKPVDQAMLDRALVKMRSSFYDSLGDFSGFGRADMLASFALFDDNPAMINDVEAQIPESDARVDPEDRGGILAAGKSHRPCDRTQAGGHSREEER